MMPFISAVGANMVANGLANGLGAASVPSAPAVAPAAQLGYTLQPSASLLPDYGYSLANEVKPAEPAQAFMPLIVPKAMTQLVESGAATPPAPKACDSCAAAAAAQAGLSGPLLWAATGALVGWAGGRGAVKGAVAGYLAAWLLGVR